VPAAGTPSHATAPPPASDRQQVLHQRRPGQYLLFQLRENGQFGFLERPVDDSQGRGMMRRVGSVGLVARGPFDLGCRIASLTHRPSGWLSARALREIVAGVALGYSLEVAA
jgi:hypothetical protein